ncbi:ERF family protein [Borreliella afzelii]|uniref:Single-stranded DNA-binding protein n=1 Tax=Borreliella afzelii TaxID=29518 RepID=A0A1L4DGY6_BORAF|nr:single-stranded DNA-binding protein [Borreliella afzelii]
MTNNNNQNIQNNIQAKIKFRKDMQTLRMNLPGIDKSLINKGYGYKYQNFNDIVEEIYNVIKKHNLELDFEQNPISKEGQYGIFDYIRTTFYSTSAEYEQSFDTRIHIDASKNNSIPQQVGSAITYFKRYALVGHLNIKSEVDTDAALNYNDYENENSTPNKQISVNKKQEQKNYNNQNQKKTIIQNNKTTPFKNKKKDSFYHYGIFKEALSNIKNWVHDFETKDNINSIIQKISFIQNVDPNSVDDVKKIEADLIAFITKNAELKSPMFWAAIIKNHFKKTNRLKDLKDFDERFMPSDQRDYNDSPLIFFDSLKEDKQFDFIFAA